MAVLLRGGGISPAFPAAGGGEECVYPLGSGVPWGVMAAWVGAVGGANYNSQKALREGPGRGSQSALELLPYKRPPPANFPLSL